MKLVHVALVTVKMRYLFVVFTIFLVFLYADLAFGIIVIGEGNSATERATDISLHCDVKGLHSDDEIVRVTWYSIDQSNQAQTEIFCVDLTNDHPAFLFSSKWAGRGMFEPNSLTTIRMPSRYVTRDFSGVYRCQVNSLMSSGFDDVKINVLYGPGSSIIISPGGRVEKQEGEELTLTCSAQCNPACSYRWYKAGRQVSTSAVMFLASLKQDHSGLYACQARNEAGRSIKPLDLRVSFPASILNVTMISDERPSSETSQNKDLGTLKQAESIILTCVVKAWPAPSIEWSRSNIYSFGNSNISSTTTTQVDLDVKSSSLVIKSATCYDNGEYICKAWNSVGIPAFRSLVLNMSCEPFEKVHSRNCQSENEANITINLNKQLSITICFFGNPTPEGTLEHLNGQNGVIKTYFGNVLCNFTVNQCETIFSLAITSPEQYGPYKAKVFNSLGNFEKNYEIISQQPPLTPTMFLVSEISHTSACFSWKANFNGGSKQTFSLKVHASDKLYQETNERGSLQNQDLLIEEEETRTPKSRNVSEYFACASKLLPSTQYEAVLTVSNIFGVSESSRRASFKTENSVKYNVSIPSWLSGVQVSTGTSSFENTSKPLDKEAQDSNSKIGLMLLEKNTSRKSQPDIKYAMDSHNVEVEYENKEDQEKKLPYSEETKECRFLQLLDKYFSVIVAKEDDFSGQMNGSIQDSNYSINFKELLNENARTYEQGFREASNIETNIFSVSGVGLTTSELPYEALLTTPHKDLLAHATAVSPLILSTMIIGIVGVLTVVIAVGCIAYFKRQGRSNCIHGCERNQRDKLGTGEENTVPRTIPTHSRDLATANRVLSENLATTNRVVSENLATTNRVVLENLATANRVLSESFPPTTCVFNENASLSSPPEGKRPRLSTPDIKSFRNRDKQTSDIKTCSRRDKPKSYVKSFSGRNELTTPASAQEYCSEIVAHDLAVITLDSAHVPCHSYLELCHFHEGSPSMNVQPSFSSDQDSSEFDHQNLRPPNHRLSFTSSHQTYLKGVFDEESEISPSYLDLYETITNRSRSRSPSNVYDPFLSDVTSMNNSTISCESFQNVPVSKGDSETSHHSIRNENVKDQTSVPALNGRFQNIKCSSVKADKNCVQLRPKKMLPSLNRKSTLASDIPKKTGKATEFSYELVDFETRKRLASGFYLPMASNTFSNCITPDRHYENFKHPKCLKDHTIGSQKIHQCSSDYSLIVRNSPKRNENIIAPGIQKELTNDLRCKANRPETDPHLQDKNESRNKNANQQKEINKHNLSLTDVHSLRSRTINDKNHKLETGTEYTSIIRKTKSEAKTNCRNDRVKDDIVSPIDRDSPGKVTTCPGSVYDNGLGVPQFRESLFGSESIRSRFRKTSSESGCGLEEVNKLSYYSNSSEERFIACQDEAIGLDEDIQNVNCFNLRDRGDSGVYFKYRNSTIKDNHILRPLKGNGVHKFSNSSSLCPEQNQYEEPVLPEHIYTEVFHLEE